MFGLGFGELVLIFLILLIFIGPKKLPELAKGLGQGIKEFQKAAKGLTDELQNSASEPDKTETPESPKISDATQRDSFETTTSEVSDPEKKEKQHS
jgi:sec-independent protein translocase protein TatA